MERIIELHRTIIYWTFGSIIIIILIKVGGLVINTSGLQGYISIQQAHNLIIYFASVLFCMQFLFWKWILQRTTKSISKNACRVADEGVVKSIFSFVLIIFPHIVFWFGFIQDASETYTILVGILLIVTAVKYSTSIFYDDVSLIINGYRYYFEQISKYEDDFDVFLRVYFKESLYSKTIYCARRKGKMYVANKLNEMGVQFEV